MNLRPLRYGLTVAILLVLTTLAQAGVLRLAPVSETGVAQQLGVPKNTATCVSDDGAEECFSMSGVEISYASSNTSVKTIGDDAQLDEAVSTEAFEESDAELSPPVMQVVMSSDKSTTTLPGDANHNNHVYQDDATILAAYWQYGVTGTPDATWEMGDFNGDGKVDGSDATILAGYWNMSVPEPTTIILLISGLLGLIVSRRLRRTA